MFMCRWQLICNDFCQEINWFPTNFFYLSWRVPGRAPDRSVPGIGHSDIRGFGFLLTYRSMVRRESCRLLAWIKIYSYNVNRGEAQIIQTLECSKTLPLYPVSLFPADEIWVLQIHLLRYLSWYSAGSVTGLAATRCTAALNETVEYHFNKYSLLPSPT